jgi:hypothetical protein
MSGSLTHLRAALSGRRQRSSLYRWMWDHHGMIAEARTPGVRSDWVTVARELAALGVTDSNGKPFKSETVRRTWARVAADAKAVGWTVVVEDVRPERPPAVEQERQRQRAKILLRPPSPLEPVHEK